MANTLLLQLIQDRMTKLTKSEQKIAKYILDHRETVLNSSLAVLSDASGTSDASIIRFCRNFGCKGYQDFKIKLAQESIPNYKKYNSSLEKSDTTRDVIDKIFNADIFALDETLQSLNTTSLELAAERIAKARKVYIACSGNSMTVGIDSKIKLLKIGIASILESDFDIQLMTASRLSHEDVVLCISHTGSTKNIYELLNEIKKRNVFIILISAEMKTPIEQLADLTIHVCAKKTFFTSESPSARIAEMVVIDIILALIAKNHIDTYVILLEEYRKATANNKL